MSLYINHLLRSPSYILNWSEILHQESSKAKGKVSKSILRSFSYEKTDAIANPESVAELLLQTLYFSYPQAQSRDPPTTLNCVESHIYKCSGLDGTTFKKLSLIEEINKKTDN